MDDDRQRILTLLRTQEAATARGDAKGVAAPLSDHVVSYDLPPPLEYRGAAARDTHGLDRWFATWREASVQSIRPAGVRLRP